MKTSTRTKRVLIIPTLAILLFVAACQKNVTQQNENAAGQSAVKIYLTDDPSLAFDKVWLDIQKIEIKAEDDSQERHESEHQDNVDDNDKHGDSSGGWITVSSYPGVYDILQFRNGLDTLFATGSFPAAHALKKLRVTLGNKNSVVLNGTSFPLILKGNGNFIVIKMDESAVSINAGRLTNLWIDIDAGRSISIHGNNFELKPAVKVFSREATGSIEGRVLPKEAGAVVMAINGTDTASARAESEGAFRFTGLKAGNYSFLYHATTNNYRDTIIHNVIVKTKEDSKLPTVMLHK